MFRHPLARRPDEDVERDGLAAQGDDATRQRDVATAAELRSVVATAIARSRNGTDAPPTALRTHLPFRRAKGLAPLPMDVPDVPPARDREHGTYLAIWCHRLERLGDRLLAYGSDDDGHPVRWIDEPHRLGWLEDELAERDGPIPVTIGHWQLV